MPLVSCNAPMTNPSRFLRCCLADLGMFDIDCLWHFMAVKSAAVALGSGFEGAPEARQLQV